MLRVALVLRSTEVHPVFFRFVHPFDCICCFFLNAIVSGMFVFGIVARSLDLFVVMRSIVTAGSANNHFLDDK